MSKTSALNPSRNLGYLALATAALLGSTALQPAAAQQVADITLSPLSITATKTSHNLDEIPAHVTVIDNEQIESRSPSKLDDLLRDLPGVDMVGGPRRIGQDISIRGMSGQRVVTTLDGARQNFNGGHKGRFFLDPDLLRQVEVVRGSNALHGSGAIGGVMALETKEAGDFLKPGQTMGFRTKYGYSGAANENYYAGGAFARYRDNVDIIANASHRDGGTLELGGDNELPYSAENLRDFMLKTTLRSDFHKLSLSAISFKETGVQPLNPDSMPNTTSNTLHNRTTRMTTYSATYNYANPDMPLLNPTMKVYHNSLDINEARVPVGAITFRLDTTNLFTDGYDLYNTSYFDTGALKHAVTVGNEYYTDRQKAFRNNVLRPGYPIAESQVSGYYVQDEIELFRGFTLTPAGRYDTYQGESNVSSHVEESKFSPRIAANWQAIDWLSLYSSYGYGFRAPSLLETYVSGTNGIPPNGAFIPNPNLRPETTESIEGGFRTNFKNVMTANDTVRFNATYFYTKAEDFIETKFVGINQTYQNTPNAQIHGAELSTQYDAPSYFGSLAYSRIRGENTDTNKPLDSISPDKVVGIVGGKLPEYGVKYGWRTEIADKQTKVSGDSTLGLPKTGGYAIHGVFVSWLPMFEYLQGFRVDAGVENMFDTSYRRHQASLLEEGRDYRVSVSYTKGF